MLSFDFIPRIFKFRSSDLSGSPDERPASSLSMASSKSSRIPVLSRSNSLREKKTRVAPDSLSLGLKLSPSELVKQSTRNPNIGGLYRSSSFATSRGMREPSSPGAFFGRGSVPQTPELQRKKFHAFGSSYVSPYSRRVIAAERKSQSHAGVPTAREKDVHSYHSPQVPRRTSLPASSVHPCSSQYSPHCLSVVESKESDSPEKDDDNTSEKSFCSVSSSHSCDIGYRRNGSGFWGTGSRRPRNILHCTHAHDPDPDDYLTPTQRAARKIRELQADLKRARREISEKDEKISSLTRTLVELRMSKAETDFDGEEEEKQRRRKSLDRERNKNRKEDVRFSPEGTTLPDQTFRPQCLTPSSDESDQELKILSQKKNSQEVGSERLSLKRERKSSSRGSPTEASVGGDSDSGDLSRSLADSGHYEDLPSPCLSSRDSLDAGFPSIRKIISSLCFSEGGERDGAMLWAAVGAAEEGIRAEWSKRIEELKTNHMEEYHEMKERHNDKVEMLLSKLSDANLKYFELRPQYDKAQEKVRELEKEVARLEDNLRESEIRHKHVYLQMYLKGQQAAKFEVDDSLVKGRVSSSTPPEEPKLPKGKEFIEDESHHSAMVFQLMKQLAQSEDEIQRLKLYNEETNRNGRGRSSYSRGREDIDPGITLQFLKSAIYYFLTDRENAHGHLRAIESILGYSTLERRNIDKHARV